MSRSCKGASVAARARHPHANRCIVEALEPRQLLSGAPDGFSLVDTLSVPADGSSVASTVALDSDRVYLIRASGTVDLNVNSASDGRADAEYARFGGVDRDRATGGGVNYGLAIAGVDLYDLEPDTNGHKGPLQNSATYDRKVVGNGQAASFSYVDNQYADNAGSLTVELFEADLLSLETVDEDYPPTPIASEPHGLIGTARGAGGDHAPAAGISLDTGVRYFDGTLALSHNDLWSSGFGGGFGHTRSWTNFEARHAVAGTWAGAFGNGWLVE